MKAELATNKTPVKKKVLVIGGRGYIGRHVANHLQRLGADVIIGTRGLHANSASNQRVIALHKLDNPNAWRNAIDGADAVVNAVGILRQRIGESYEQVHHFAVAGLAQACKASGARLVHVSALGLEGNVNSHFMRSKLNGETALKSSGADWHIVRPSIVDGRGGFGAKWFRQMAAWPIHLVPANAIGLLAPININDLGEAIARLALSDQPQLNANVPLGASDREYDLGGHEQLGLLDYLNALTEKPAVLKVKIPAFFARGLAHLCDLFHVTPYSYGHYELLKVDNIPRNNRITELLGRPANSVGVPRRCSINHDPSLQREREQILN